ncbi:MAG: tetratricopeptide (TPR) repeat protein [Myxococcota bacterium]|jgi:tetratricopeptide (TPR) repeat protein
MAGCPVLLPEGDLPAVPYNTLPERVEELAAVADKVHQTSRKQDDLVRARTALKKADHIRPDDYGTLWRLARVDGVLARLDEPHGEEWAREGRSAGARARELKDAGVEGHLYFAIALGLAAKYDPASADPLIKQLIAEAERADALDSAYAGGEARRVLGAIYIYAPPWPTGAGDLDEAIEVLESLNKDFPDEGLNAFYLAEAYRKADQPQDAIGLYKHVLSLPRRGTWGLEGKPYRRQARELIRRLRNPRK